MARNSRATASGWLRHQEPEKIRKLYIEHDVNFDPRGDIVVAEALTEIAQQTSNVVISDGTLRNYRSKVGLVSFKKPHSKMRNPSSQGSFSLI